MTTLIESRFVPVVNRDQEIGEALQRLEALFSGVTRKDCVLFWYGVPTVGKTTILKEIRYQISTQSIPTALINFEDEMEKDREALQRRIAQALMDQLSSASRFVPGLSITDNTSATDAASRLLTFIRDLSGSNQRRPFVLFFDTVESCDQAVFRWMQEKILAPILNDDELRKLIIMAGRAEPRTAEYDLIYPLEAGLVKFPLQPFDGGQTSIQLKEIGVGESLISGEELVGYTSGLPGLNDEAARWLNDHPQSSSDELLTYLVDDIIFTRHAGAAGNLKDLKDELLAVSLLHHFDEELFADLAASLWKERYLHIDSRVIRNKFNRLLGTRLVESLPGGYAVPRLLRLILTQYMKMKKREIYYLVYLKAAVWFKQQVEQKDFAAIGDRLYYLGELWNDIDTMPIEIKTKLQESELLPPPQLDDPDDKAVHELQDTVRTLHQQSYPTSTSFDRIRKMVEKELPSVYKPATLEKLEAVLN